MLPGPVLVLLALTAVAAMACGDVGQSKRSAATDDGSAAATVAVVDLAFEPEAVDIAAGETVAWSFQGRIVHDVALDGGPASPKMRTGQWQHTFEEAGTYDYVCTLHPNMTGTVTVG